MRRISCSFGFFAAAALMLYYGEDALAFFAAAAVHELGHLAALAIAGESKISVRFSAMGITISRKDSVLGSRCSETAILLAGPLAGAVSAAALRGYSERFFAAGMILSLANLLLLRGTDGGSVADIFCKGGRKRFDAAAALSVSAAFFGGAVFCGRNGINIGWAAAAAILLLVRHLLSEE